MNKLTAVFPDVHVYFRSCKGVFKVLFAYQPVSHLTSLLTQTVKFLLSNFFAITIEM